MLNTDKLKKMIEVNEKELNAGKKVIDLKSKEFKEFMDRLVTKH